MHSAAVLGFRVLGLAALLMVLLGVAAQVTGVARAGPAPAAPAEAALAALALLLFCVLAAAVLSWMILRSSLSGWPLTSAVALAHFGLGTLILQMESAVFLPRQLPPGFVTRMFAMGALIAVLFAPVAVWMHRRFRRGADDTGAQGGPRLTRGDWILRLSVLSAVFVALTSWPATSSPTATPS